MAKAGKPHQSSSRADYIVVYARIHPEDYDELRRREEKTGATIAAQVRILIHEALHRKTVIR